MEIIVKLQVMQDIKRIDKKKTMAKEVGMVSVWRTKFQIT